VGGSLRPHFTDLVFAYYTWCIVAANASAEDCLLP
jgi:hypothetical protein